MEVVFTFSLKDYQRATLQTEFPRLTFHFNRSVKDIEVEKATVIVTSGEDIDRLVLERATSLKWLMVTSAGVEKMPLAEIEKKEIRVTNVRGIHKTPMAESVLAHILALRRSLPLIYENQKKKEWGPVVKSSELKGSTALILGPGAIGSEIGRLLQAFGVKTIGCNRSGTTSQSMDEVIRFEELKNRLGEADYVISVLPSTNETKGLLTKSYFEEMKDTTVFMNFGRGDLVEEAVLLDVLKKELIGHAVLDVFEEEPLPIDNSLWSLHNCTVSPHVSSLSGKYMERALVIFQDNLHRFIQGELDLENTVDLRKGY